MQALEVFALGERHQQRMIDPGTEARQRPGLSSRINDGTGHNLLEKIRINGTRTGERQQLTAGAKPCKLLRRDPHDSDSKRTWEDPE